MSGIKRSDRRMRRKITFFIILFFFSLTALKGCSFHGREGTLVAIDIFREKGGEEALRMKAREGSTLGLTFIHSIYHTPQIEIYTVLADCLLLREVHFGNLEAMGYYDPHPRGNLCREGNLWKLRLSSPICFQTVKMRIPYTAPLRLTIDGSNYWAPREQDQGALLTIRIVHPGATEGKGTRSQTGSLTSLFRGNAPQSFG